MIMKKVIHFMLLFCTFHLAATPAPDFTVTDSDGKIHNLYADYIDQNKVVVLEIFFTTCPPCNTHAPYWETLYQNLKMQHAGQVEFFMLTNKSADTNDKVAQYKTSKNLSMPGVGSDGNSFDAIAEFQNNEYGTFIGTPTFIVIAPGSGEVFFDVKSTSPQETMNKISQLAKHLLAPASPGYACSTGNHAGSDMDNMRYRVQTANWDTSFNAPLLSYSLAQIPRLKTTIPYTVSASRNDNHLNGVSTYDMLLISRHILGIAPFTQNWQKTAGDVNRSGSVTTADIVQIQKLILGVTDTFLLCPSWTVTPASAQEVNGYCVYFQGIKMGDVNGSAVADNNVAEAAVRNAPQYPLEANDRLLQAGETFKIHIRAAETEQMYGLQGTLNLASDALEFLNITSPEMPGFGPDHYYLGNFSGGFATVSWFNAMPVELNAGDTLLSLEVRILKKDWLHNMLNLSSRIAKAEMYTLDGDRPLTFRWTPPVIGSDDNRVFPNPVNGAFTLYVPHAEAGVQTLRLFDARGALVWEMPWDFNAGANYVPVNQNLLLSTGLYFLRLENGSTVKVLWLNR